MTSQLLAVVVGGARFRTVAEVDAEVTLGDGSGFDVPVPPAVAPGLPRIAVRAGPDRLVLTAGGHAADGPGDAPGWTRLDTGGTSVEARTVPVSDRLVLDLRGRDEVQLTDRPGADVMLTDPAWAVSARRRPGRRWEVTVHGDDVFVDDVRHPRGRVLLHDGDHLGLGPHELVLHGDELHVDAPAVRATGLPRCARSAHTPPPGYPDVRRSPRLVHRPPEGTVVIDSVPDREDRRAGQLVKLVVPPLVMLAVTAGTAFLNGNPVLVLATGSSALVTLGVSVHGFVKDRRREARARADEREAYRTHLDRRATVLHEAAAQQRYAAEYHLPDGATLTRLAGSFSPRVFERRPTHEDFLRFRLGLASVPATTTVEYADADRVERGTELDDLARHLSSSAATLDRMPLAADLRHGPVGYVGPRRLVVEQLQLLVDQLAFFHSYHDVQLVVVFPDGEQDDWSWTRWYRHASLQDVNLRGHVHDQRSRDQVLATLNQVLRGRQNALTERRGQSTVFGPHYVVLVLDETLVLDHVVWELLRDDPTPLGCSVVVVQDTMSALSDAVTTVVDVRDRDTGVLVLERGELRDTRFALDHRPADADPEHLPRTIGALNHRQDVTSSIPRSVTFLELYGVERVEQLGVADRWAANSPHRTLGVPLGLRGAGDVVKLDLHEKAHGPHGLVAGTTGSGKSEIIQSYILSLAVCFHPHDVAFLLIDYKGGGMANLFADLPHLLGTITNLDGAQSMRALVSINAELKRRQRVFAEHDVNHINQYQKLVKSGAATDPMPHLFLISDEFAELKSEQPEFMDELISTARIGRSLGIHLILATQKPSGVVNDQIWSNSKFKLALKVADRADSMEIIKTPDAAEITLPGRAYLQVGNNEIYELFQSAWSGADYEPDKEDNHQDDHAIYAINSLGQYEILTSDLSGLDAADEIRQVPTELDVVVEHVRQIARATGVAPLPRPWLPPLPPRIVVTDLLPVDPDAWDAPKSPLRPVVGTVDIPGRQTQETLRLDLSGDGHLAVFASPGYGKSTFLQTLVMDLARVHSPEHLHVYLLDLGTNGLLPLQGLPHVADTITVEDERKVRKFVDRTEAEMKRRKQLLSAYAVANLPMYERASGEPLPEILLVVDGVDGLKGTPVDDLLGALLAVVAREGAGLGVHLALSAGRPVSVRPNVASNIKVQLALTLNEDSEVTVVVGRTALRIDDLPGRGLVRLEQPELFQTALPVAGEDMLAVIDAVQQEAADMSQRWSGPRPQPVPVVPERLDVADLAGRGATRRCLTEGRLPVGLGMESVEPVTLDPARHRHVLVLAADAGVAGARILTIWQTVAGAFPGGAFVLDDETGSVRALLRATRPDGAALDAATVLTQAVAELDGRIAAFQAAAGAEAPTLAEHARTLDPALVVLGDAAAVVAQLGKDRTADLARLLTEAPRYAMSVVVGGAFATAGKGPDDVAKAVKAANAGLVLGKLGDQSVLRATNLPFREPDLGPDQAYVVADGKAVLVKLPVP